MRALLIGALVVVGLAAGGAAQEEPVQFCRMQVMPALNCSVAPINQRRVLERLPSWATPNGKALITSCMISAQMGPGGAHGGVGDYPADSNGTVGVGIDPDLHYSTTAGFPTQELADPTYNQWLCRLELQRGKPYYSWSPMFGPPLEYRQGKDGILFAPECSGTYPGGLPILFQICWKVTKRPALCPDTTRFALNGDEAGIVDSGYSALSIASFGNPVTNSTLGSWALYLDGQSFVYASGAATFSWPGDFTVRADVYPLTRDPDNGLMRMIFSEGAVPASPSPAFFAMKPDGKIYFGTPTTAVLQSTSAIPLNAWSSITVSRVGGVSRMWINDNLEATATDGTSYESYAATGWVGTFAGMAAGRWLGYIRNFNIAVVGTTTPPPAGPPC